MKKHTAGFTIIELMIASMVFSLVLILCVTALLQIGRMYYKGVTTSRTQEAARSVLDEISQAIQFSAGDVTPFMASADGDTNQFSFCVDNKRYSVYRAKKLVDTISDITDQAKHVLVTDSAAGCLPPQDLNDPGVVLNSGSRELLPPGMRIANLTISEDALTRLYTITIRLVSGDGDLLTNPAATDATCAVSTRRGGQFCAVSELTTTVQKRL